MIIVISMRNGFLKKGVVGVELSLIVLSVFAFAFIIGSIDLVSGYDPQYPYGGNPGVTTNVPVPTTGGAIESTAFQYAELSKSYDFGGNSFSVLGKGSDGSYAMFDKVGGKNLGVIEESQLGGINPSALEFADAPAPISKGFLSSKLGLAAGSGWDAIVSGFQWAATAYLAGMLIGGLLGMTESNTEALSTGLVF